MNAPASSLTFASGWAKITLSSNDVTDLCAWLSKNTCVCVSVRAFVRSCSHEWTNEQMNELRQVCGWTWAVCMHVYVGMCLCACIGLHRHSVGLGLHIWIICAWHSIIKLIDTIAYSRLLPTINDKWHLFLPWWSAVTLTALKWRNRQR